MSLSKTTLVTLMSMLMSEISEEAYCATWEMTAEYAIWEVLQGQSLNMRWQDSVTPAYAVMLRELSAELDGWIILEAGEDDTKLVFMAEWQELYKIHVTKSLERQMAESTRNKILNG